MSVPLAVQNRYAATQGPIKSLRSYVDSTLRPWCERHSYPFLGRVKSVESLSEKLESGRYKSWRELDDTYACTIVVPTRNHVTQVAAYLDAKFERVEVRDRTTSSKPPTVYRFDSTRWIGRVSSTSTASLAPGAEDVKFEVQVPTAFEHAWAVATHDIVYKSDSYDWKALRIASLLKASVEQIELIIDGFQSNADSVFPSTDPETAAVDKFIVVVRSLVESGDISVALRPASWSRFGQNVLSLAASYSSRGKAAGELEKLAKVFYSWAQSQPDLHDIQTGSLFQVVLRMVNSGMVDGAHIRKFPIVDSDELRSLHGVDSVDKRIDLT